MLEAITGDIAGLRFEFNNYRITDFTLFNEECSFTDDTICTIAIADLLLINQPFDHTLRRWYEKYPSHMGGYGLSFKKWLKSGVEPYGSDGNRSAMRASPVAWYFDSREEVLESAKWSTAATYNHTEGVKGAVCIADLIHHLRKGYRKEDIRELAIDEYGYNLEHIFDQIRTINTFNETCKVTIPQSIICSLESSGFEEAIHLAVSSGGDTDTISAITYSLTGSYYDIPADIEKEVMQYLPIEMLKEVKQMLSLPQE